MSPWNRLRTSFVPPRRKKIVLKPWKYAMFSKSRIKKIHISDVLKTAKIGVSCTRELNFQFCFAQKCIFLGNCKIAESSWRLRKSTKIWFFRCQAAVFAVTSETAIFDGCSTRNARFLRNQFKKFARMANFLKCCFGGSGVAKPPQEIIWVTHALPPGGSGVAEPPHNSPLPCLAPDDRSLAIGDFDVAYLWA